MKSGLPPLSVSLRRLQMRAWLGVGAQFLLRLLAFGLPLLLLYGLADFGLALPENSRRVLNLLLASSLLGFSLHGLRGPGSRLRLAGALDRLNGDRRRTLTCALDLERAVDATPLQAEFRRAAAAEAQDALDRLPLWAGLPLRALRGLLLLSFCGLLGFAAVVRNWPEPAARIAARLRNPGADLAPWTFLRFDIQPAEAQVLYGGDLDLSLELIGRVPAQPVWLKTRIQGQERDFPAFREGEKRFSQRLEQVTAPMEFCFAVGRLRSEWRPVDVQLLPRVLSSRVRLTPPAYSGRPERTQAFGERILQGLPGTGIEVELESNRPLAAGVLRISREGSADLVIAAEISGNTARWRWTLDHSAAVSLQLRDLLGNEMARPLSGHQRLQPDAPPEVTLHHPPRFMLATPNVKLAVEGGARDDVGVTQLRLVRGMAGFIDRPQTLESGLPERHRGVKQLLDLSELGVAPGETLEFYLEATDHRPDGNGRTGVSDLSRILIISEAEYAERMRRTELLEGFRERFASAGAAMESAREALQALQREVDSAQPTQASLREALDRAAAAQRAAEAVFNAMAEDFPLYELERASRESLLRIGEHFRSQAEALETLDVNDAALDLKVTALTGAQRAQEESFAAEREDQDRFLKVGDLLRQAMAYQELVRRQELLVRWFERFAYALPAEARDMLRDLAEYQDGLRQELADWTTETRRRAALLSDEDRRWAEEAEQVILRLQEMGVDELMRRAAESARNEANREALHFAREALNALRLPEPTPQSGGESESENRFESLCRGQNPGEGEGGEGDGLSSSLQQLLDALRSRSIGQGQRPGGQGGGIGGFSDDGYATQGSSPLQLPMLGPNRLGMDLPYGQNVEGFSRGTSRTGPASRPAVSRGDGGGAAAQPIAPTELILERAPPQYREAIRTFFDLSSETSP